MVLKLPVLEDGSVMLLQRQIQTFTYAANSIVTPLPLRLRPNLLKNIIIHVNIAFDASAGGSITARSDFPWSVLRHITIRSVRNEILKSIDARTLTLLNKYERGTQEYSTFLNTVFALQSYNFSFDVCIPFENFTGITPEKTILNLNEFTELYFDFLWGDVNNIYNDTLTNVNVTGTIIALEREPLNMSDELEPRKKMIDQTYNFALNSTRFEYLLPEATLIKTIGVMFYETVSGVRPLLAGLDEILLRLSIEDDDNAHSLREWTGSQIRSSNKSYYGLESVDAGFYVIEFDQLRDLSSLYKTFGINYPKLKLEIVPAAVNATAYSVNIFIRQITTPPSIRVPL